MTLLSSYYSEEEIEEMRKEFAQFAKNSLYISDKTLTASILNLTAETLENDLDDTQKKFLEK